MGSEFNGKGTSGSKRPKVPSFMSAGTNDLLKGNVSRPSSYSTGGKGVTPNLEALMKMVRSAGLSAPRPAAGKSRFASLLEEAKAKEPEPVTAAPAPQDGGLQMAYLSRALKNSGHVGSGGDSGHAFTRSYSMDDYNRDVRNGRFNPAGGKGTYYAGLSS